ncbi:MAG: CocE/NonD family hydrolase [Victivallales bacterium]|nr:CocE/NonD family hydrolase [Victivallales bacterium]
MKMQRNIKVRMRDGIRLATDIILPEGEGPFAAVLIRTPYNRAMYVNSYFQQKGIALVTQDTRGRYESEGEFYPFVNEYDDGMDTLKWLKVQPWSNGKVAMFGDSYLAHTQFVLMQREMPSFTTLNPRFMCGDGFAHGYYAGGIFNLALTWSWLCLECASACSQARLALALPDLRKLLRTQPTSDLDLASGGMEPARAFRDFVANKHDGPFWDSCNFRRQNPVIEYPVLLTGGWYDFYAGETIKNFLYIREHSASEKIASQHRMVIGHWSHGILSSPILGEIDFGEESQKENGHSLEWIAGMLQGKQADELRPAPVTLFVMGRNAWRHEWQWPPRGIAERDFFLQPQHALSTDTPDIDLACEECIFDWENPVPTHGGNHSIGAYNPGLFDYVKPGPYDQTELEARDDVTSFTTAPLQKDTEVIGIVRITLYISSEAEDADFFAKIVDVHPDGKAFNVTEGCQRASCRIAAYAPQPLTHGEICRLDFELGATAMCFKAGHAIRVDVSCSNFPLCELNPAALKMQGKTPLQRIHYGRKCPSHITLPCDI